ncbi:sodium-coupled monocarboxylate transporter 2 [Trichonephila inaurata madagascariensis]|uniref:Sodium-coupled monocarboxylate transporter 2 n=1 Tax=Trichonephila inaurata madagascariensis TaxID=2747483 RepID=A0A8X6YS93_9ARAC|nr:sodium-coupled monocarboxylate transporter 2 [Trichonephila inaurata madagascariensis]
MFQRGKLYGVIHLGGDNYTALSDRDLNQNERGYFEKRFGRGVRLLASSVFILQMMLYMAIILYAPALALNVVTGLSKWSSVYLIGFVCTFYSTLGGMRAVLWTDLFQSLIMLSAASAVCIKGTLDVGGLSEVLRIAEEGQRIQFFEYKRVLYFFSNSFSICKQSYS